MALKIKCPICMRPVMTYDGKTKVNPIANCRYCKKEIIYDIKSDTVRVGKSVERQCSSGLRFG